MPCILLVYNKPMLLTLGNTHLEWGAYRLIEACYHNYVANSNKLAIILFTMSGGAKGYVLVNTFGNLPP